MMKKITVFFLVFALLLSLTACGTSTAEMEAPETAPAETEAPTEATTEPTTEPTLSPEEVLYNSLSDRMQQAVDAGIVELSQLEDLSRIVTVGEASEMLQKAFVHRTGVESMTLRDLMASPDYSSRNATRGWIMNIPGLADTELVKGNQYKDYEQWMKLHNKEGGEHLWHDFRYRTHATNIELLSTETADFLLTVDGNSYVDKPGVMPAQDYSRLKEMMTSDFLYGPCEKDKGFLCISEYAFAVYDQTDGRKYIAFEDGCINPEAELTVEAAAEHALIFYNYPNPMAYPTFVVPEEVGTFNPEIITADLLAKETDLPEASCQNLSKEWHGTVMDDFQYIDGELMHLDYGIYEYEIQQVKEAGFNFISLNLDFSWLQENMLNDPSLAKYENSFGGIVSKEDVGKLSLERLEKLDRVIALGMKYDIHVNLRCTAVPDMHYGVQNGMHYQISRNANQYGDRLAQMWQAIARRYAGIPNKYLSFTLFGGNYDVTNAMVVPSVHAIREESPERCIIAEITSYRMKSKEFAELGVALSYRLEEPEREDYFFNLGYHEYWGGWGMSNKGNKVIKNFNWPYKGKVDAQALFDVELYGKMESMTEVMATAQEHGVGFMLGDFGVSSGGNWWFTLDRVRYADEPYFAMIEDITSAVEELGYGWCFNRWYGPYGVAFCLPAIQTSTYEQVADYPYYIDQGMMDLFREINGVQ